MECEIMEDWEKENKALEEKYYPITWYLNDGVIEIYCKNGKLLPIDHKIYTFECDFIKDEIMENGICCGDTSWCNSVTSGEICCI